ncbi:MULTISPECIES: S24 family peptidase [unclassified Pseudoalteromonas]|uniref:S24 family peptidase n=1 Tax=unclassified Pseudoalteromonas TaxID=194690 RepID=UPI00110B6B09|nr:MULTISPECIES: S24 family peptidase [unclassified Pseudoalteromonas]MCP4588363.1 helix-turn-helix domain-containing protein [Pseudoalteromonas sp.]TMO16759.1 transcriptional regulator [Pseudoalteromonas sp. S326]
MAFEDRLEQQMKAVGVKGIDIVNQLKVSKGSVSQWRNGVTKPGGENAIRLAKFLRCNLTWLIEGKGTPEKNVELELGPDLRGKAPLISWVQAGKWKEIDMESLRQSDTVFYQHTANVSDDSFALRVKGDSMTSFSGGKSIPEGSVIIVDPNVPAEHGKVVVARLEDSDEATLKQLVIDGGAKYLKPFNNSYPTLPINGNCTIIGVVKQLIQDF